MNKQNEIIRIIQKVSKQSAAPDSSESLFDSGYLDSFALADTIAALEEKFGISIPDSDVTPRKFETVEKIEEYLGTHGV